MEHRYRTVKIPEELVNTILKILKTYNEFGYRSHSEFIIDAIRRRTEELLDKMKKVDVVTNDILKTHD